VRSVPRSDNWVIDASAALSFVLDEREDAMALRAIGLLSDAHSRNVVATHFDIECANGLVKAVRRGRIAVDDALEALLILLDLPMERAQPSAAEVDALRIAIEQELSAYDAAYVALAEDRGLRLVTADARLARALAGTAHDVRLLDDMDELDV